MMKSSNKHLNIDRYSYKQTKPISEIKVKKDDTQENEVEM